MYQKFKPDRVIGLNRTEPIVQCIINSNPIGFLNDFKPYRYVFFGSGSGSGSGFGFYAQAYERRWIDFRSDEEIVISRREILTYLYLISQILADANSALKNS